MVTRHSATAKADQHYMELALQHAQIGAGHTFPNPAVGCVIVSNDSSENIIGQGFHPRAGYPHAEVFALLEAAGHVPNGVEAATSILQNTADEHLLKLVRQYTSEQGAQDLFADCLIGNSTKMTAYVTLEPCCHFGQTPPCAVALQIAGVQRVVVGIRDPNPKVDGGGVLLLQEAGVTVDILPQQTQCHELVRHFFQRITAPPLDLTTRQVANLNSLLNRRQSQDSSSVITLQWSSGSSTHVRASVVEDEAQATALPLSPEWIEHLDGLLWNHELVVVRFTKSILAKRKFCKIVGERLAQKLGAKIVVSRGHTVALYRPGVPPIIDVNDPLSLEETKKNVTGGIDQ